MKPHTKPELLAPAGSLEAFFAAMEKGADAVYAGLQDFSARARAKNFTLAQMERMLAYAHGHGKKVYVTLNTLVKEKELPLLVDTLSALSAMKSDGVIIQDLAVARVARRHFPTLPLHASTQMTVHNIPGVKVLKELGFERAVLARELALDEIAAITAATDVEIECFVHGALCFSVSGQCFFSSLLGGHSGNRGRCAQPCRRLYNHRGKEGHFFSTSDLSAIDMIPDLVKAGVKSLKIEGRMKSAEYVASVVESYRMVLDAPEKSHKEVLAAAKGILKYSFGRTPTKGFLASQQPDDIANPWQKGGTGRFVGVIKNIRQKSIVFESRDAVYVGDRLRVQPKSDMAGQAWTVRELFLNKKKVHEAVAGSLVEVETPFSFKEGDSVYKVSSREAFTLSDAACQRKLESSNVEKMPCRLTMSMSGEQLTVTGIVAGLTRSFVFEMGQLEPSRSDNMAAVLSGQFSRCGDTPFKMESLDAPGFPAVMIPSALFKDVRRRFYQMLADAVAESRAQMAATGKKSAMRELEQVRNSGRKPAAKELLEIVIDQPKEWRYPLQNGADATVILLSKAAIHQLTSAVPRMRGFEEQIIWQLPFMLFDKDIQLYRSTLNSLYQHGFRRFEAANISHFALLHGFDGIRISAWHRCFSMNSQALAAWSDLGAESATLYMEDDGRNISDLLDVDAGIETAVVVYSHLPVMTTKIRIKDVHANTPLRSDRGEVYRVTSQDGLQTISSDLPFSLTARHGELRRMGGHKFILDLSGEAKERWGEVIAAFKAGRELPGTTEFNFAAELI